MSNYRNLCFVNVALKTMCYASIFVPDPQIYFFWNTCEKSLTFCGTEPINKYWYDLYFIGFCHLEDLPVLSRMKPL